MSLYHIQKFLFDLNRDPGVQQLFKADRAAVLARYELNDEERGAVESGDIGLLYVLGANGQLLMHYAALLGMEWSVYLKSMREGVVTYGPVRAGIYAMTTRPDEKVANV